MKVLICTLLVMMVGGLVVPLVVWPRLQRVTIMVTNEGHQPIYDVGVGYRGGAIWAPVLPPGASRKWRIRPAAESGLDISFRDADGKSHASGIDVYLEPGYSGTVAITVEPGGTVSVDDRSHSGSA